MANPFFSALGNQQAMGGINPAQLRSQIESLKKQYSNPQEAIQNLMNSGKITQAQYNAAVQRAQQLKGLLGGK